jgi:hypothetical protein
MNVDFRASEMMSNIVCKRQFYLYHIGPASSLQTRCSGHRVAGQELIQLTFLCFCAAALNGRGNSAILK